MTKWLVKQDGTGHEVGAVVEIADELQWRHWRRAGLIEAAPDEAKKPRKARNTSSRKAAD
jgi:hypothetical protein